ncbi:MAG: hypothetical protein Q8W44_12555 [Candidatus Palauibacterales bacterium]|nr:hypothetical protein [Candidatus Palauibacterales bacterium]
MSRDELAERVDALEVANRRFRVLATLLGLGLVVLVAAGWVGPGWDSGAADGVAAAEAPREVRARSLVLVDDSGRPAVRMETTDGSLRISMLRSGGPGGVAPPPAPGDSNRVATGGEVPSAGSSLVLYPSPRPGIVLYGPHGRKVVRLGEVEAVRLR